MNWPAAKAYCETRSAQLAIVSTKNENNDLLAMAEKVSGGSAWIGCSDIQEEGTFAWVDGTRLNETVTQYTNWARGEPERDRYQAWRDCCQMYTTTTNQWYYGHQPHKAGQWSDWSCRDVRPFFCKQIKATPAPTTAPPTAIPTPAPVKPYFLVKARKTWPDAKRYCEQNGGELTVINNAEDNRAVQTQVILHNA